MEGIQIPSYQKALHRLDIEVIYLHFPSYFYFLVFF